MIAVTLQKIVAHLIARKVTTALLSPNPRHNISAISLGEARVCLYTFIVDIDCWFLKLYSIEAYQFLEIHFGVAKSSMVTPKNPVILKTKDREIASFKSMILLTHRHWPPADSLLISLYRGPLLSIKENIIKVFTTEGIVIIRLI